MVLWRRRISQEDRFAEEVTELARSLLGATVKQGPGFSLSVAVPGQPGATAYLGNLYAEVANMTGEERASRLRTAVLAMAPPEAPSTWEEAEPRLMPAVRNPSWAASAVENALRRPLLPFVSLAYVVDFEHGMAFVRYEDLADWGVGQGQVEAASVANLAALPLPVARSGTGAKVLGPDGYASSWLAVPSALAGLAASLGPEVVALAPSRDHLELVEPSDAGATCRAVQEALDIYKDSPRRLSPVPYLVNETLEPWLPPEGHPAGPLVAEARATLAAIEYGHQEKTLVDLFTKAQVDVFVSPHTLMRKGDGTLWSYSLCVKQVTDGLIPQADYVMFGDNTDVPGAFTVPWDEVLAYGQGFLQLEAGYDPQLWRYHGWPSAPVLDDLKARAVPMMAPPS